MSSKKSSSSSSKELRTQTEPTATMLTMDQQGVDDMILMKQGSPVEQHSRNDSSSLPSDTNTDREGKPSWWKRGLDTLRKVASNDDDDDEQNHAEGTTQETAHYKPLQDHSSSKAASHHPRFAQSDGNERLKRSLGGSPRVLSESLLGGGGRDETTTRSVIDVLATRGARGSTTQEDALQEDCSFFYKAHDEGDVENNNTSNLPPRGRFRALRFEEHQHAFSYQDAVDVLTPSFLQAYKSRYEQLNQADPLYADNNNTEHELILSESQDNLVEIQRIVKSETTVNSSIFYEHDGRVLMRLPIDAVRLVMDPDLEAGVLSVEQWRHDETDPEAPPGGLGLVKQDNQPLQERPSLRYVLTVSPDLYRKIVSEMSDSLTNPFCGFNKCCSDSEKADIRIAIFILVFVFFILFISTEVLGPHS